MAGHPGDVNVQNRPTVVSNGRCLSTLARQIGTALASLAALLEGHAPSCICCHCLAEAQGYAALNGIEWLCTFVDAKARYEWETQTPGLFAALSRARVTEEAADTV